MTLAIRRLLKKDSLEISPVVCTRVFDDVTDGVKKDSEDGIDVAPIL